MPNLLIAEFQGEYRWLSNFWPCTLAHTTEHRFGSAEAMYQATKFPVDQWGRFMQLPATFDGARQAKRWGKGRKHETEALAIEWMRQCVALKFSRTNPGLLKALLDTACLTIEEGNRWGDRFWGISPPQSGLGENWLGRIIMDRRSFLLNSGFKPGVLYQ